MDIQVGKHSFNIEYIKKSTKKVFFDTFKHIDERILEIAWSKSNPKKGKRKSPEKSK
jgi:hypothetical protein